MNNRTSLVAIGVITLLLAACSKHSPENTNEKATNSEVVQVSNGKIIIRKSNGKVIIRKVTDLGTIDITDGKSSSHVLPDGVVCVITPTILSNNIIRLVTRLEYTNSLGMKDHETSAIKIPSGDTWFFTDPYTNTIRLRPRVLK
jgi:hypothetical protein